MEFRFQDKLKPRSYAVLLSKCLHVRINSTPYLQWDTFEEGKLQKYKFLLQNGPMQIFYSSKNFGENLLPQKFPTYVCASNNFN